MKKLSILTLIIAAVFALSANASAQSAGESKNLTDQQKMLPFVMGMSLSVLGEMHDENYAGVISMLGGQISYYSAELKPVADLEPDAALNDRREVVATAIKALRQKSSASDRWQMLAGDYFGNIFVQLTKNRNGDDVNVEDLKFDLEMIGSLADSAPDDIPARVVKRFRDYSKLRHEKNLLSDANVKKLATEVAEILDGLSK